MAVMRKMRRIAITFAGPLALAAEFWLFSPVCACDAPGGVVGRIPDSSAPALRKRKHLYVLDDDGWIVLHSIASGAPVWYKSQSVGIWNLGYLYWWDVDGNYHQHHPSRRQSIHISDAPMMFSRTRIEKSDDPTDP